MNWEEKFLVISHIKGFSVIFEMVPDNILTDSEDLDDDKVAGKKKKRETRENTRKA
jgi:hypothetical protein